MITDICIMRVLCDQCRTQTADFAAPTWEDCRRAAQAQGWKIEIYISEYLCFCPACRDHRQPPAGSLWAAWQAGADFTSREAIARREAQAEAVMAARWQMAREVAELRQQLTAAHAAASPAIVEEYGKACHHAGERGYAAPDFAVWVRRRQEMQP